LRYGKGTEVVYDFEAIERDLFDKFIFGKPLILIDEMPRVVFRKDAHDATFYESIMASVEQVCKLSKASCICILFVFNRRIYNLKRKKL